MSGYGTAFQAGYVVEDLDAALEHWTQRMKIGPFFLYPSTIPFVRVEYRGALLERTDIIRRVAVGYAGDMMIELIEPGDAPSAYREFLDAGLRGLQHLGHATDQFDAMRARAIADGGEEVMAGVLPGSRFSYIDFGGDQPGTIVELMEIGPDRRASFDAMKRAAAQWDGTDPIRSVVVGGAA